MTTKELAEFIENELGNSDLDCEVVMTARGAVPHESCYSIRVIDGLGRKEWSVDVRQTWAGKGD